MLSGWCQKRSEMDVIRAMQTEQGSTLYCEMLLCKYRFDTSFTYLTHNIV